MMLLLLHGPATEASRIKLQGLRSKFDPNSVVVYGSSADLQTIKTALSSQSLFTDQQLIILENPPEGFTLDSLTLSDPLTLIVWFDREVDTKKWPGFKVEFFPEDKAVSVFPLLDLLANQDNKAFLELAKLKNAGFDIYYILTMVFYLLRSLAVTPKNAPDFVKRKLDKQRAVFGIEKVTELYRDMIEIDFKIKSGNLEKSQAEFLLINKFLS